MPSGEGTTKDADDSNEGTLSFFKMLRADVPYPFTF